MPVPVDEPPVPPDVVFPLLAPVVLVPPVCVAVSEHPIAATFNAKREIRQAARAQRTREAAPTTRRDPVHSGFISSPVGKKTVLFLNGAS
jgi:hypothetical protein